MKNQLIQMYQLNISKDLKVIIQENLVNLQQKCGKVQVLVTQLHFQTVKQSKQGNVLSNEHFQKWAIKKIEQRRYKLSPNMLDATFMIKYELMRNMSNQQNYKNNLIKLIKIMNKFSK
ncbi:Hypothetical_protein [Hexamita inflata]|uniref:Hypothetical_protein n=2 Tax=Hexamita inflata TaxID=28002 RepID=A0ABP1H7T5_9EUKA